MYPLRCLLAHPDPQIRHILRSHCDSAAWVRVLGEASQAAEALELADHIEYGALFLDPGPMGDCSGLELARVVQKRPIPPALLFIARSQEQALAAFEIGALDYFLWPTSSERLLQSLRKLQAHTPTSALGAPRAGFSGTAPIAEHHNTVHIDMENSTEDDFVKALEAAWTDTSPNVAPQAPKKLPVQAEGRTLLIPFAHIVYIAAEDDYSFVHTTSHKYLSASRLKDLENRLARYRFFRIHRKYLVNLDMVTEVNAMPGSNLMLRTAGSPRMELPVSRRRIQNLKTVLGL